MPLSAFQQAIRSNPATDFTEELITNAGSATVNLTLPTRDAWWFIRAIAIIATQNLQYELQLFTREENMGPTIGEDYFLGVWQFGTLAVGPAASPGYPFDPADVSPSNAFFHYYVDGNMMPYVDMDQVLCQNPYGQRPLGVGVSNANPNNAQLHVRLINRSATTKDDGADGALQVIFYCSSQGQQV